jgi:uncharacterized protein YjiS (DUF1127 family)
VDSFACSEVRSKPGPTNLATYWVRREAIKTLEQLDERALRDIGLPRCHIEAAVNGVTNPDLALMQ